MIRTKKAYVLLLMVISGCAFAQSGYQKTEVRSPDAAILISVLAGDSLSYTVNYRGREFIRTSALGLQLTDRRIGLAPRIKGVETAQHHGVIKLPYGNSNALDDTYNEAVISFEGDYALIVRAYNDGVAYRFVTAIPSAITVVNEIAEFTLGDQYAVEFPQSDVFTSWEVPYIQYPTTDSIAKGKKALTPVLFSSSRQRVVIAESDVRDYPGMYLMKSSSGFCGKWAPYPKRTELGSWGNFVSVVKESENFIAKTAGSRAFPWRVIIPTDDDRSLLSNDIVYKLASPLAIKSTSWIHPGKATWEWWHDAIVEDAGIPSGMKNRNTALYKHYIDFAGANHLEYLMLDAGWSDIFDLSKINKKNDIHELIAYGKKKHVKLFLWCVATTLIKDLDHSLDLLHEWGVAGIKVDFFDRDDQEAITWFEKIAAAAAKRKLLVNFHGCSKPTGLERAYPNIVNYEAVRGAECSKWDRTANPDHHVNVLFSRMLAGPLDYTPGSMRNCTKADFKPVDPGLPSTQGTRCHELSMYVLFDQPFAMLCDAPAEYRKYPDIMKYLSAVPTSFDETRILDAKAGEYAVVAKRTKKSWYAAAMTNWTARDVVVDFAFLPEGQKILADVYRDAPDADEHASHYIHETMLVDRSVKLTMHLAQGGGAVVYVHP